MMKFTHNILTKKAKNMQICSQILKRDEFMPTPEQIKLVEASLFIAGRPLNEQDLMKVTEIQNRGELDLIIEILSKNLEERNSFIEIMKVENQYIMRVKPAIKRELGDLQTRKTLPDEYIKLLAIIALRQPLKTSEIRNIYRGKIKEPLKELAKKGFIQLKTENKIKYVITTPHFASVFNLDPQNMKTEILKTLTKKISLQAVKPPKSVRKDGKKKKLSLTEAEKQEIDERYYELMERLKIEREEEQKRLEEEAKRKAEEEALMEKMASDPMASLIHKDGRKDEDEKINTEDEQINMEDEGMNVEEDTD